MERVKRLALSEQNIVKEEQEIRLAKWRSVQIAQDLESQADGI